MGYGVDSVRGCGKMFYKENSAYFHLCVRCFPFSLKLKGFLICVAGGPLEKPLCLKKRGDTPNSVAKKVADLRSKNYKNDHKSRLHLKQNEADN